MKKIVLLFILLIFILLTVKCIWELTHIMHISHEDIAEEQAFQVADSLNHIFAETNFLTIGINDYIEKSGKYPDNIIEQFLNNYPGPFYFDRLYIIKADTEEYKVDEITLDIDNIYKTKHLSKKTETNWLQEAFLRSSDCWQGLLYDSLHEKRALCKSLPIISTANTPEMYIIALYDVVQLYQFLQDSGLNRLGVPYIIDTTAHFIAHPLSETRSLITLGEDYNDQVLINFGQDIINRSFSGKEYIHLNTVTGTKCKELLFPIPNIDSYLGISLYNGESLESASFQTYLRRSFIRIFIYSIILFVVLLMLWKPSAFKNNHIRLQLFSSILFFVLIVAVIYVYNRFPRYGNIRPSNFLLKNNDLRTWKWDSLTIIDKYALNTLIDGYQHESLILYNHYAKVIPTGIYIYDIQFTNSHEVKISGSAWQKFLKSDMDYPSILTDKYEDDSYKNKGILFPGSRITDLSLFDSIDITLEKFPAKLYRWNFDIDLGQKLSYSLYPFGKSELSIPLWSKDFDDNTLLVPDLDSYKQIYPSNKPGLDPHFQIEGWNLISSCYTYKYESYLCSFGNMDISGINQFPELTFNISISRKFVDILVCKILPLGVILTLLFTLIFIRKDEDGFNNVIGCSGLFFVLMLDHINLRETVISENIMYLEYCYFVSYFILLLVTITSFATDEIKNQSYYRQKLDYVLKNYYWSIILGAMAIVSLCYFF